MSVTGGSFPFPPFLVPGEKEQNWNRQIERRRVGASVGAVSQRGLRGTARHCRPLNNSSQTPSGKAISWCERQGDRHIWLQRITLMYASVITFWDHEEKMAGKVFQTVLWSDWCLSWSFSQERMKIFLNLNPAFTVWGHTLCPGKAKCPVIFYACLLLWSFFLGTVPLSAWRNQGWKERCGWQVSWQPVNVELLNEGHTKWFVDDPRAVKHVCTKRSSNNSE